MSTISCPRCQAVFPLAQVAQFDQFTCGACGNVIPVPMAKPVAPGAAPRTAAPVRPAAAPPAQAAPARPAAQPSPARPAALPPAAARAQARAAQPAPAPVPQARATAPRPQPAPPATPAPAAPTRGARPQPVTVVEEPEDAAPRRGRRAAREEAPKRSPAVLWGGIGGGVLLLLIVGFVLAKGGSSEPGTEGVAAGVPAAPLTTAPVADPDKDPAAWKALPADERKQKSEWKLAQLDPKSDYQAKLLHDFFLARDEKDAAKSVAREVLKAKPEIEWAHITLGHVDLKETVDTCIRDCQWSDGLGTDAMKQLQTIRKQKAPKSGPWYADEETAARVNELVAQIREEEKTLSTPFGQGVAKWVNYHRSIEVMRDFPALHGTVGPYLIFVSLPVPKEKEGKDVTLADVSEEDLKKGREILAQTLKIYGTFYDAWHEKLGPILGLTKYGPENTDQATTLLVNVFTKEADYRKYNAGIGGPGGGTRAYYSPREPRFVTTYDGPAASKEIEELGEDTAQVQCHEGVHQLVHFYTWDLVRKSAGKAPEWLAVTQRPMWSKEGFAEFFSSYRKDGDQWTFMVPLDGRMSDVWAIQEIMKLKKWEDWKLREILEPYNNGQMQIYGTARSRQPGDEGIAANAMANLFYGKVWGLTYFLWNHEEGGKPKYRDRFIEYMKFEFNPKLIPQQGTGRDFATPVTPNDFRRFFGLTDDAKFTAFEKEWRDWEAKFLAANKKPEWEKKKETLLRIWNLNPDGTRKKEPAKKP